MTIDPFLSQLMLTLIVALPVYFLARSNWRKNNSDAYESLSQALNTSGQTIDDLFKQLADLSNLQNELHKAQSSIRKLESDLNIERAARELAESRAKRADEKITRYLNGIYELTQQLIEKGEAPRWKPDQTGPLKGMQSE